MSAEAAGPPRGALAVLLLTVFVDMVGFGVVIPLMPFWAEHFGASPFVVTLLMSVYAAMQFVFSVFWGWLSDRVGRKPILLISLAGTMVSSLWMGFAGALWALFAARAMAGAMGASINVAQAYIADLTAREDRSRYMGYLGAAFGLGFIVGPAIGGLVAGPDAADPDLRTPFFVGAAISAVALVMGFVLLREPPRHRPPDRPRGFGAQARAFAVAVREPGVLLPIAILTAMGFVLSGVEATIALWTERQYGWGPQANGILFAYIGVILVVAQGGLVGPASRIFGDRATVFAGVALMGASYLLMPVAAEPWMLFVAMTLLPLGYGLGNPALNGLISRNAPADRQGAVLGASQSSQGLVRIVGPGSFGRLFEDLGRHAPYVAGGALLVAMLLLVARIPRPAGAKAGGS